MTSLKSLDEKLFRTIVKNTPLISIDLVIINKENKMLVGFRCNNPGKGFWFVPGGRIFKGEKITSAFERISIKELDYNLTIQDSLFIGFFEHFYENNTFDEEFGTHYISLAFCIRLNNLDLMSLPLNEHQKYQWCNEGTQFSKSKLHDYSLSYLKSIREI